MQYLGGKHRLARRLKQVMKIPAQATYVEPFVGSGAVMAVHQGIQRRIAGDICSELIALHTAMQRGWGPPEDVSEALYREVRSNPQNYPPELCAFIGFGCSYGGKLWDSYASNERDTNFARTAALSLKALHTGLRDVEFHACGYEDITIPDNSFIYCDPPYDGTKSYRTSPKFNTKRFMDWCVDLDTQGHTIFVSEYNLPMPEGWYLIDENSRSVTIQNNRNDRTSTERVYSNKPKRGIMDIFNIEDMEEGQ